MTGLKPQREKVKNLFASDNQLTKLPITYQDFPNLEWLVLSKSVFIQAATQLSH